MYNSHGVIQCKLFLSGLHNREKVVEDFNSWVVENVGKPEPFKIIDLAVSVTETSYSITAFYRDPSIKK